MHIEAECRCRIMIHQGKNMKNTTYLPSVDSSQIIFVEDANISQEEMITNQTALHNTQPTRNLPNILRSNNNTRVSRNYKALTLDNIDTSFISSAEDVNSSFELNTTLSSVDSEMEANYNKILSPKSHHQRKQVHTPLDIQYDIPDWNNNRDESVLKKIDQLDTLVDVSLSQEENVPMKKSKYNNKQEKCLLKKKSRRTSARKSGRVKIPYEKPDFNTGLTIVPDVNIEDNIIVQNANFFNNDMLTQSICGPNTTSNYINDLNYIGTKSIESSNIFYRNNENYNSEKQYNKNYNPIISGNLTEFDTIQHKALKKDLENYEFSIEDGLKEEIIDRDIPSNFLFKSKALYTCTCVNCTSCEKDAIFYEDPVSTSTNSDMETELFTCDFCTNIYDFYTNDYYHLLDDNWLKEFDKLNPCCEEPEATNITKEDAYTGDNNVIKLIENSANVSTVKQNELQNSQSCYIDKIQDVCVEPYSTEFITQSNGPNQFCESTENSKVCDVTDYLNLENIFMKEGKLISQDETFVQTAISTDVPVSNFEYQSQENKEDLYVIQCGQCGKLFNKKHQFSKHFTRCDFADKEDFKCYICNKIYRHKSSLAQHLRTVHQVSRGRPEKFYICNKCSKSYIRLRAFQRHVLLHD